jgi:sec-independent protein translocase protein TatB
MFDIAFSELVVVGIVALLVIGPDKLPKVARTAGHLLGRAQRYVNDIKSDINSELRLEELQKLEDEIRQNTQHAGSVQYQVGQVIKHEMPPGESPKYQAGQLINHDKQQINNAISQPLQPARIADIQESSPPQQAAQN